MLTPVWWMIGACAATWLALAAVAERGTALGALGGMLGPLALAAGSWVATAVAHRRNPAAVTSVMLAAFAAKVVIVAAYIVIMLRVLQVDPLPFVASFTAYFIGLYAIEAWHLRRLFMSGPDARR